MNHTDWYYIESRNVLGKCQINMQLWQVWVFAKILFHMKKHEKNPPKNNKTKQTNKQTKMNKQKEKNSKAKTTLRFQHQWGRKNLYCQMVRHK